MLSRAHSQTSTCPTSSPQAGISLQSVPYRWTLVQGWTIYWPSSWTRGKCSSGSETTRGDVARWGLQGIFQLGPVVGDRPLVNLGADLICITADGYIPLLQFLDAGREQRQLAVSDVIAPSVTESVARYSDLTGWQAVNYPEANWLMFNVPHSGLMSVQHVMNVQTGSWWPIHRARCSMLGHPQAEAVLRFSGWQG